MGALSKGCGTCKRRRVKCDETRPICTRCRDAGINCTGFMTRLGFVDENPRIRRSAAVSHTQSQEFSAITTSSAIAFHSSRIDRIRPFDPALSITNELSLIAFKDEIFMSYLLSKFFEGGHTSPSNAARKSSCGLPKEWTTELIKTPQKPRLKSWDALAAIVYGQTHRNHEVVTLALGRYGQALLELHTQLSNSKDQHDKSTMASITALYIYEILASKTVKGWMLHADGLGGILRWNGPWLQKSYNRQSMFLEHHFTLVAKAIMSGQGTFLSSRIWKTVPWEDDPTTKSAMDYLIDIGVDIAEYLAHIKKHSIGDTMPELEHAKLTAQVATLFEELNAWWLEWEGKHPQAATEISSRHTHNDQLFPTHLQYRTLSIAFEVCTYDTMRILLLQTWQILQSFPNSTTSVSPILNMPNATTLVGITSDAQGLGCEILRSLKYCYGESRSFKNTSSFMFIQEVAYGLFDHDSKEAEWIASHCWAKPADFDDDTEDANLLRTMLPSGQIKLKTLIDAKGQSSIRNIPVE